MYVGRYTQDVRFVRNIVRFGDGDGIVTASVSFGNVLRHNDARNNVSVDCLDLTDPLVNDWGEPTTNLGLESNPAGICTRS